MEFKKIFPNWWHPIIPAVAINILGYIGSKIPPLEGEPITTTEFIMLTFLLYVGCYIVIVFWRTGYLVVKDVCHAITK